MSTQKVKEEASKISDSDFGCCCLLAGLGMMAVLLGVAALLYVIGRMFGWIV